MHIPASGRHALDGSMLPSALRMERQVTLTAPMRAQFGMIGFGGYSRQETNVRGTGSGRSDHRSYCSTTTRSSWLMIRMCDGPLVLHAVLPKQQGAARGVRGTESERCCCFSDGRMVAEGYPIPRGALEAILHASRLVRHKRQGPSSDPPAPSLLVSMS
jgi:hypothetical protein